MRARKQDQLRIEIAMQAARLMVESGIRDYQLAKRKAASKLGVHESRHLPSNQEIEQAVHEYQSLFHANTQPMQLQQLRQTAIEAMQFFHDFNPRLIGDVLHGTANQNSRIELHLFADTPEQVNFFLMDHDIPFEEQQKRLRVRAEQYVMQPAFSFFADDVEIELVVFDPKGLFNAPCSVIDGKPMQRADIAAVRELL